MAIDAKMKKGVLLKGSVKNILVVRAPSAARAGKGMLVFTDDYSVFDYGKMPDTIPAKGEAICRMATFNFEELEKIGIKSHFRGFIPPNKMSIELVRVLYPQRGELKEGMSNYLVPLEVIFRNSLPAGSSVFKRLEKGEASIEDFGISEMPKPGEQLEKPVIDFSTKLEPTDRYLKRSEAKEISMLSDAEFDGLVEKARKINEFITAHATALGLEHADGKVEFALNSKRELMLVDVCGTLDENRFLRNGVHLSKQILRDYYKGTPWADAVARAKSAGLDKASWPKPQPLPYELVETTANLYKSVCEAWTGRRVWDAPKLDEALRACERFAAKNKIA